MKRKKKRSAPGADPLLQEAIGYFHARNWQAADDACRELLRRDPANHKALNLLSVVLTHKPDLVSAEKFARKAIKLNPAEAAYHSNLGLILKEQEKWDAAFRAFANACTIDRRDDESYYNLGTVYQAIRKKDEALGCYREAIAINPGHVQALCALASLLSRNDEKNRELADIMAQMEVLAARPSVPAREQLYFELARLNDKMGKFERAFTCLEQANALFRKKFDYDVAGELQYFESVIQHFSSDLLARKRGGGTDDPAPLFIVGMPRSGTTLVKQILATHSRVAAGGELYFLNSILLRSPHLAVPFRPDTIKLPNYSRIGDVAESDLNDMAHAYLQAIAPLKKEHKHLTDKMPHNFIHAGMIYLLLPNSRVIHCRRDPMDTCLSLYMQNFKVLHPYSYSLQEIGRYYAGYHRLMEHWHRLLPGFMHAVQYEALVGNPEAETRKLLEFCGLDWEAGCLEFYKLDRHIKTASEGQADQPLYGTSIGRWQNYGSHLEPLRQILLEEKVL